MPAFKTFNGSFEKFKYAVVYDGANCAVPISRLWAESTAILVFLRHFGCMSCRAHAQDVWKHKDSLQRGGGRIIFIGNGAASFIDTFRSDCDLGNAPIYTDPHLRAFELAGFKYGLRHLLKPASAVNAAKLLAKGHKNGNPLNSDYGSNFQLGGVVVVNRDGRVTYHYISEALGDVPEAMTLAKDPAAAKDATDEAPADPKASATQPASS